MTRLSPNGQTSQLKEEVRLGVASEVVQLPTPSQQLRTQLQD